MAAAVADEAALVADVLASEALVVAVDADDDAEVAELAAAVAERQQPQQYQPTAVVAVAAPLTPAAAMALARQVLRSVRAPAATTPCVGVPSLFYRTAV